MEQTPIKVQVNPPRPRHVSEPPHTPPASEAHEAVPRFPSRSDRMSGSGSGRGFFATVWNSWKRSDKMKIFVPGLLATLTGVLLGICLLVLFRSNAEGPTVTVVPGTPEQTASAKGQGPTGTSAATKPQGGAATLAGQRLYVWQVGSFGDKTSAEKAQQELQAQGLSASVHGSGPYQLFAGLASDKAAGRPLELELNKRKITFYAKEFAIPDRQGVIPGLKEAEAAQVTGVLGKEVKLAHDALNLAVQPAVDAKQVAALKEQWTTLGTEEKKGQDLLAGAGLKEQSAGLDALHQVLGTALDTLAGSHSLLAAEEKLTPFYIRYESLAGQIVK